MYLKFETKPFSFEHCWEVLLKHDKWGTKAKEFSDKRSAPKKDKKGKNHEGSAAAPNVVQEGVDGGSSSSCKRRDTGNKKAKEQEALKRSYEQAMNNELEFLAETK
ncbi:hypothetical protein BDB00DRAFT_791332 [Zychaea mexicana]|uniref:uncharacterized protein n=1 Tax=Zychaea mexicana TaxID=64656 RepID=UPI0022FE09D0|nr:uncharacterized protein BDB00DRAFT_791332 [Zychaea mexicana]KAI9489072.1 hypothetical protein BDB00DRAFT_791332 [Zychaea mexicana]